MIQEIFFRFKNVLEVIPSELQNFTLTHVIVGGVWFLSFYFLSRWVKAYIIRLIFFSIGLFILWNVMGRDHMLDNIDIFASLGLLIPQIPIVELTYLILRERTLFMYGKILEFILHIASPFIWLFNVGRDFLGFFKAKQEEKVNQQAYEKYYDDDFKQRQEEEYHKEQARQDNKYQKEQQKEHKKSQQNKETDRERKTREYEEQLKEQEEIKRKNGHKRWDSSDYYIVLELDRSATFKEIKKKYRKLSRMYHPDLSLFNKKEAGEIMKKINHAYEKLEKLHKSK